MSKNTFIVVNKKLLLDQLSEIGFATAHLMMFAIKHGVVGICATVT